MNKLELGLAGLRLLKEQTFMEERLLYLCVVDGDFDSALTHARKERLHRALWVELLDALNDGWAKE